MTIDVRHGDSRDALRELAPASVDAVVTDPPYALVSIAQRLGKPGAKPIVHGRDGAYKRAAAGFMGKQWDTGEVAFAADFWRQVLRVLKPGGHVVAFGGTRTYHRLAVAIEDAGFEIRDQIGWLYGSGFPKSHDVAKGIDKAAGAQGSFGAAKTPAHQRYIDTGELRGGRGHDGWQRPWMDDPEAVANAGRQYLPATDAAQQWQGWGTALKPAWEPIVLARKPLAGTVAGNVLAHGTGALNIDGCRVEGESTKRTANIVGVQQFGGENHRPQHDAAPASRENGSDAGRWPANVIHDGSDEVVAAFPENDSTRANGNPNDPRRGRAGMWGLTDKAGDAHDYRDTGTAARFFYSAKADAGDRLGSKHPTVKPVDLMAYLCRLITPPGGLVLDPFAGSGTTGMACLREGFRAILIEREAEYVADIKRRLAHVRGDDTPLFGGAP